MGRQLQHVHSGQQFEHYHPSCLWSILHILDYHRWRRTVSHKKHRRGKRAICFGNPKTISLERESGEVQSLMDPDNFLVEQDTTENSIEKHSGKASIKALISEEMSKEENHRHSILGFPAQSKFQQTHSIHHLDSSDFRLGKISNDWTNPIIVLHKDENTSSTGSRVSSLKKRTRKVIARTKKHDLADSVNGADNLGQYQLLGKQDKVMENSKIQKQKDKQLNHEILHHQVKEYVDVLEIFNVNKEEFLKTLKEPDIGVLDNFPGQKISNRKVNLNKSGSFPVADSSRLRYRRSSTLEHKQNETWAFPKGEMPVCSTAVPNPDSARSQKGYNSKTVPSVEDYNVGSTIKQKADNYSQGLPQVSSHQRWDKLVKGHFRGIKQRIKLAIKENRRENDQFKTEGREMPRGAGKKSMGDDGTDSSRIYHDRDGSDPDFRKSRRHMRTTSLNESLERYAQLFESSSGGEAKLPHSNSLKLRNDHKTSSRDRTPKFFRRISSLSDLESFLSLLNELAHESEMPISTEVDLNTNTESDNQNETKSSSLPIATDKLEPLNTIVETQFHNNSEQGSASNAVIEHSGPLIVDRIGEDISLTGEFGENNIDALEVASIPRQDQEIASTLNPSVCHEQTCPDLEPKTCFPENMIVPAEVPISEAGSKLKPVHVHIDEADASFNILQNRSNADLLPDLCDTMNADKDDHLQHFELGNNDASFNYVREVLQLSGFIGNEILGTWYSLDQPLNPLVYKELEEYLHHELQYSPAEIGGNCEHQLLFDLINEVLLELYERSFTYFPQALSFNRHIHPMPKGNHVLDEAWSRICQYLSFRTNLDQSLDDIVAQDLAKGDGWLTHQFETECVVLELEEFIYDELLDELIYS